MQTLFVTGAAGFIGSNFVRMVRGRNELEITDVNNAYIERGEMTADKVQGFWADAGENIDFYLKSCNMVAENGANKDGK